MPKNIPNLPERLTGVPGVEMVPPPPSLKPKIDGMIMNAVRDIAKGRNGEAHAWIEMQDGDKITVNVATAIKIGNDIKITGYFAKKWKDPVTVGGAMTWDF